MLNLVCDLSDLGVSAILMVLDVQWVFSNYIPVCWSLVVYALIGSRVSGARALTVERCST